MTIAFLQKNPGMLLMKPSHATIVFLHSARHVGAAQHTLAEFQYHSWKYMSNRGLEAHEVLYCTQSPLFMAINLSKYRADSVNPILLTLQ